MDLIILILLVFVSIVLVYLIYKSGSSAGSIESTDLINFSNTLNSQIQDIRKEISSNSKESRSEIEAKLNIINKQIFLTFSDSNLNNGRIFNRLV